MAISSLWGRRADRPLKYDTPKKENERDFSIRPNAIAAIQRFKSKLRKQEASGDSDNITGLGYEDLINEIEPFILRKRRGETNHEYQMRADELGMMSWSEVDTLLAHEFGMVGSEKAKDVDRSRDKRLAEMADGRDDEGEEVVMIPYLVNITWTYEPVSGRSPPTVYSIEGVFYGWDAELTMEAARDYMMDNIVPTSSYKTRGIMDLTIPDINIEPASRMQVGAMGAEFAGSDMKMRISNDMDDERFTTGFLAMFTNPNNGRQYEDRTFGYYGTEVAYKWMGRRIVSR